KYGLGHTFSDRVLIEVAHRVENCVKPIDTVARVGGDEFVVLLSDIKNFEEVLEKAAVIDEALKQPFKVNGSLICSNNYIGMVYSNINYEKPEDFLRAADMAMHYGKKSNQITPVLFDVSMQAKTLDRLQLEADLQEALEKEQFFVKYQPILCLETGKVVSFEALVRWHHPKRGIVSPVDFIPLAEETGIIIPLGKWVLSEACQQLKYWLEQFKNYPPMTISVNLSGMQLADPNFLDDVDHILESHSLNGSSLKLEITESILVEKAQENKDLMTQLKKRNIELSIDDFGTGYSSLAYLQTFPIDTLKIDRSFISRLTEKDKNLDITQTIITLAHSLDLDVISEGVETEQQLDILRSLQCEYGQGYLFSPPLHPQDIPKFLAEH
ncbi:MAG: putative bifunctional diguanylate cyclase/phosphodiesterase, partial [Microcoleaceae cyanobacterium]